MKARFRLAGMNRTEARYARYLEMLKRAGQIQWYAYEPAKIRLADNTFYTPDFAVVSSDQTIEFHEVKGFWRDDARVKIKVAAEHFPARFVAVTQGRHGGWEAEKF